MLAVSPLVCRFHPLFASAVVDARVVFRSPSASFTVVKFFSPTFNDGFTTPVAGSKALSPPKAAAVLLPTANSYGTQIYADTLGVATVISSDGRVLVNGPQWDNWGPSSSIGFVARQIDWMLSCKADVDGDGDLTVFDFLEFQNLFDRRDVRADVFYDGRFDVFDFLEFFNQFDSGCR